MCNVCTVRTVCIVCTVAVCIVSKLPYYRSGEQMELRIMPSYGIVFGKNFS